MATIMPRRRPRQEAGSWKHIVNISCAFALTNCKAVCTSGLVIVERASFYRWQLHRTKMMMNFTTKTGMLMSYLYRQQQQQQQLHRLKFSGRSITTTTNNTRSAPALSILVSTIDNRHHAKHAAPLSLTNPNIHYEKCCYSTSPTIGKPSSPFHTSSSPQQTRTKRPKKKFIPRKAAITLTTKARDFFQKLLKANPDKVGVLLNYHQSSDGTPRMVFSFQFIDDETSLENDVEEGISLELLEDGMTPKPPSESYNDGLPKLYIHHNAFMKVLGATLDVDLESVTPILTDREGNRLDPNNA